MCIRISSLLQHLKKRPYDIPKDSLPPLDNVVSTIQASATPGFPFKRGILTMKEGLDSSRVNFLIWRYVIFSLTLCLHPVSRLPLNSRFRLAHPPTRGGSFLFPSFRPVRQFTKRKTILNPLPLSLSFCDDALSPAFLPTTPRPPPAFRRTFSF